MSYVRESVWRISPLRWTLLTAALVKSPLCLSSCLIDAELSQNECAQCGLCPPVGHLQRFINTAVVVHAHLYKTTHHKHKKFKPRRCRAPLLPLSPCSEHDSYTLEMRLTLNAQRSLPLYEVQSNSLCFLWFVCLFITAQHFHISKAHALHSIPSDRKQ